MTAMLALTLKFIFMLAQKFARGFLLTIVTTIP